MPLITIVYASQRRSLSLKREIAEAVTALTAQILRKDPKVTAVIVSEADAADWFAGGASLAEQGLASYWIDVHVSEGTNTKDEKAAYLAAMFDRMADILGPLEKRFGRKLEAKVELEPELIGGVRVVVGDEVLDTSVKARLERMKSSLVA